MNFEEPPKLAAEMPASTSNTKTQSFFTAASGSSNAYDGFNNDDEDEHNHTSFFNETSRRDRNWVTSSLVVNFYICGQ